MPSQGDHSVQLLKRSISANTRSAGASICALRTTSKLPSEPKGPPSFVFELDRWSEFCHLHFAEYGAIAQLVERLLCKQEVVGSKPSGSTVPIVVRLRGDRVARSSRLGAARQSHAAPSLLRWPRTPLELRLRGTATVASAGAWPYGSGVEAAQRRHHELQQLRLQVNDVLGLTEAHDLRDDCADRGHRRLQGEAVFLGERTAAGRASCRRRSGLDRDAVLDRLLACGVDLDVIRASDARLFGDQFEEAR